MRPERFGRYVLLDRIAVGGMAEVFRAVLSGAEGFRRTLIVKRILAEYCRSGDFVEMFVREARICALLSHPSIVQVYDFGNVDGNYFLAMEYVRGRNLQQILRKLHEQKRPFPVSLAAFIGREVAAGLGYAHALAGPDGKPLNLIHRDVSASNIMCASAGGVKLLDFGIAKAVGDAPADRTERGNFKGRHAYMAPERIKREPIDGRADLFSLGVVMWETLVGRRLFRGATDVETLRNVLEAELPLPSSLRPEIPRALDAVIMRALERDPSRRYPTGQAMADDLEAVLRETKHQSRMLPDLLRELFGDGVQADYVPLSAEELLDGPTDSSTGRGSGVPTPLKKQLESGPLQMLEYDSLQVSVATASGAASAPADPPAPASSRPRRLLLAASGIALATAASVLLLARPGSGHSRASADLPPAVIPAPAALPEVRPPEPPPVAPEAAPAAPAAPEAAGVPPAADETAAATEEPGSTRSKHRSHRANRDRIKSGLSIDPFADDAAPRGR